MCKTNICFVADLDKDGSMRVALSAEDRLDILDLYADYSARFDHGDAEGWADLFAPDGRFTITGERALQGRDELSDFARSMLVYRGMRHHVSNIRATACVGGARGSAYVLVLRTDRRQRLRLLNAGDYDDELVRVGERWVFGLRTFTRWIPQELADGLLLSGE
jgi:hypothetical protein